MGANRLLIVDDQQSVAVMAMIAAGCGYEVEVALDPVKFLDRVSEWQPSHILLDLHMPVVDGIQILRALSTRRIATKIIISSGVDAKVVESARRLGLERGLDVAATLLKPFRAGELRRILEQVRSDDNWLTESVLQEAIENHAVTVAYQPKIELATGRVAGYEALARWRHPRHGLVPPEKFVPVGESSGLIEGLTERVLDQALAQLGQWGEAVPGSLAINLSGRSLRDLTFADRLAERCAASGIAPERIVLELTETSTMADPVRAMDILTRLRIMGFRLSIDDFGTGFSSLAQLARLPFSELKVDKSFVLDALRSPEARTIVRSTIDLAHNLGLRAVAEGVEDGALMQLMAELGCDQAQGFHIAEPMPAEQLLNWQQGWTDRQRSVVSSGAAAAGTAAGSLWSPWAKLYDGSEELRAALVRELAERINPLWDLGRNSLIGWRPTDGGIEALLVPYQSIVDRFAESRRLLQGRRFMGDRTFEQARTISGARPVHVALPFRISDTQAGAVPSEVIEQVLRRYGITETQHRAVALFDIVGFSRYEPRLQVAQLNSLECSINAAQGILRGIGKAVDLARTTTGDGFYVWSRDKGPEPDLDTYLLTLLVLVDNGIARRSERSDLVPMLRTCFSVGPHYSYYQVDGLDPRGHDYIVGDVTIGLARMAGQCLPEQVLVGDFRRPAEEGIALSDPLAFVDHAETAFSRFEDVRVHGQPIRGIRCYFTGERHNGAFDTTRFSIRDKHGFEHRAFNQKFNVYLKQHGNGTDHDEALFLGKQQADLADFDAVRVAVARA
jgi:EAL domain-containing protein (putative c-di-GMP-specific phosphodiesterase class I)